MVQMKPVAALISCCKTKKSKPDIAKRLHTSALFTKSLKYAEQFGLPIYILSAKYHLIPGNRIIQPYEKTLLSMPPDELEEWARIVAGQVQELFDDRPLLILAGEKYLEFRKKVSNPCITPMQGLEIGKRLARLTDRTK